MDIVFLNLADNDPQGITAKSVKALKTKYPPVTGFWSIFGDNAVTEYNLIPLLAPEGKPKLGDKEVTLATVKDHCTRADKVMVAIHGNYDNRDRGVVTMGFGEEARKTVTLDALCDLIGPLLPGGGPYSLTLVMCYGARTANYRLDQFGEVVDWTTSFAYRFYERLREGKSLRLVAFTGAVSVDEASGRFKVQTEAAIGAEIDLVEHEAAYTEAVEAYNQLMDRAPKADGDEYYKKYQLATGENKNATPSDLPKYADGYRIVEAYAKIINQNMLKGDKSAVGKVIFIRPNETTIVLTKLPRLRILHPPRLAS